MSGMGLKVLGALRMSKAAAVPAEQAAGSDVKPALACLPTAKAKMMAALRMSKMGGQEGAHASSEGPMLTPWRLEDPDIEAWSLSNGGLTINHARKHHDIALLDVELKEGVASFAFRVNRSHNNKGHNIFIGVIDAHSQRSVESGHKSGRHGSGSSRGSTGSSAHAGAAWFWHPYDGQVRASVSYRSPPSPAPLVVVVSQCEFASLQLYATNNAFEKGAKTKDFKMRNLRGQVEGKVLTMTVDMIHKKLSFSIDAAEPIWTGVLPFTVRPM
jgi:hypothetical protein